MADRTAAVKKKSFLFSPPPLLPPLSQKLTPRSTNPSHHPTQASHRGPSGVWTDDAVTRQGSSNQIAYTKVGPAPRFSGCLFGSPYCMDLACWTWEATNICYEPALYSTYAYQHDTYRPPSPSSARLLVP